MDPDDFVRFEVQAALERGVRVIPVLVDDARPLRRQELPAGLHKLARLHALELSSGRYQYDVDRLLNLIQKVLTAVIDLSDTSRQVRGEIVHQEARETISGSQALPGNQAPATADPAKLARRRQAEKRALYIEARAELRVDHFDNAIGLLDDLLVLDPDYPDADNLRNIALRGQHLASTYASAVTAEDAGDWIAAMHGYGEILEADPTYRDASARKEACEGRQKVVDLQAELRYHADTSQWQAVLDVDAELTRLDPSSSNPDGLTTRARASLEAETRHRLAQEEAERKAQEEAERQMRAERAVRRGKALIERKARQEAEQKARQEAEQKARQEAEQKARLKAREEARRKAEEEAERKAQEEAERHMRAERAVRRGKALIQKKTWQEAAQKLKKADS